MPLVFGEHRGKVSVLVFRIKVDFCFIESLENSFLKHIFFLYFPLTPLLQILTVSASAQYVPSLPVKVLFKINDLKYWCFSSNLA